MFKINHTLQFMISSPSADLLVPTDTELAQRCPESGEGRRRGKCHLIISQRENGSEGPGTFPHASGSCPLGGAYWVFCLPPRPTFHPSYAFPPLL